MHQRTRNMRDDENDQSGLEQHVSIASARVNVERYDAGGGQRHEKDIEPIVRNTRGELEYGRQFLWRSRRAIG